MRMFIDRIDTPIGAVMIASDGQQLCALDFEDYEERHHALLRRYYGDVELCPEENPAGLSAALARYFAGDLAAIENLPVATPGTAFQQSVWRELRRIPSGTTISYGELARAIGRPKASRAVGAANGANPIPIVVPCHRVIGANGTLTGFGGGMPRKQWLLQHEGALLL